MAKRKQRWGKKGVELGGKNKQHEEGLVHSHRSKDIGDEDEEGSSDESAIG